MERTKTAQRPRPLPPDPRKDVPLVDPAPPQVSETTVWMLAVRDQRCRSSFAKLFDHFAPRLKGFLVRSGSSPDSAEEVVQEVMLILWQKAHLFDPHRAQVSAWVYQIAKNRQIDMFRKSARPVPEELAEPEQTDTDASQIIALEQETSKLKHALNTLKGTQRKIIEQAYLGELTHQEISRKTGLPLGTIKSRIRLGMERLRHELNGMRE